MISFANATSMQALLPAIDTANLSIASSQDNSLDLIPDDWIDSPPTARVHQGPHPPGLAEHFPPGLAGIVINVDEGSSSINLTRRLDNMAFNHRMSEREEEAAVFAMMAVSGDPGTRTAFEVARALAVEVGTDQRGATGAPGTGQALQGTMRMKATRLQADRARRKETEKQLEWIRTHRLLARVTQMKILRDRAKLSNLHRMARDEVPWPTLCALKEQIQMYASHSNAEVLDITFFYLATFPGDGATYDSIYDYLSMIKGSHLDFVDTYIEIASSPFINERSFFVDSHGEHLPLPVSPQLLSRSI